MVAATIDEGDCYLKRLRDGIGRDHTFFVSRHSQWQAADAEFPRKIFLIRRPTVLINLPPNLKPCFECILPIRWGDMDVLGHVNNTNYFRYMESLRMHWFEDMGLSAMPEAQGMVMMNAFCNFLRPLRYPGEVFARQFVGEIGRSAVDTYAILELNGEPGTTYATGGATVVWCDFSTGKSAPLPETLRARLEEFASHA